MENKFYLLSLGCPKNLVDSEHLVRELRKGGILETKNPEEAEFLIVNTCGFIEDAKKESIEEILALSRIKNKNQKLIVWGCLSQRYGSELRKEFQDEVDAFWGVDAQKEIARFMGVAEGQGANGKKSEISLPSTFPYAYLKIAEGCKRRCTFCSIPAIRGPMRSFNPEEILKEAEAYIKGGIKELILVSQDTACYDVKGYTLPDLMKDINGISGDFWLRAHYFYPSAVDEKILETIANTEKIVKYIDLPFQHSEERVLRVMGRGATVGKPSKLVSKIRRSVPGVALRTTLMAGFPGETEEDFRGLMDFLEEAQFEHMGAFMYSKEEGTKAATLKGHLPKSIKQRRYDRLMTAQALVSLEKNMSLVGRTVRVLIDSTDGKTAFARMGTQSPEIDGMVFVEDKNLKSGDFADVLITEAYDYDLKGKTVR